MGLLKMLFGLRTQSQISIPEAIVICSKLQYRMENIRNVTYEKIVSILMKYEVLSCHNPREILPQSDADNFMRGYQLAVTAGYAQRYMDIQSWIGFNQVFTGALSEESPNEVSAARESYLDCKGDPQRLAATLMGNLSEYDFAIELSDVPLHAICELSRYIDCFSIGSQALIAEAFNDSKAYSELIAVAEKRLTN